MLYSFFVILPFLSPSVLEAVLEAARQKTNVVLYVNQSPLFIGYGFYNYDIIIDPLKSVDE